MPTSLPVKPKRTISIFTLFAIFVGISFFLIEIVDPAPLESLASSVVAP